MPKFKAGSFTLRAGSLAPVDVYSEILKTKNVVFERFLDSAISISEETWEQVLMWNRQDYAGLELHEFLDKINNPTIRECP